MSAIPCGIISDEAIELYHQRIAVSNSRLKDFRFRPLYYWRKHVARILPPEDSKALRDGRAFDSYLLDGPALFSQNYVVLPVDAPKKPTKAQLEAAKPSPASVASMEWWAKFEGVSAGRTVLSQDDFAQILMLEAAVNKSPEVKAALAGQRQVTFRKDYGGSMPPVQARPDVWHPNGIPGICETPCFCDMKTTASLTDGEFGSFSTAVEKCGYYRQAGLAVALATELLPADQVPADGFRWFLAAVEKDADVGGVAQLYELEQEDIVRGYNEVKADLQELAGCYKSGIWPGALGGVQKIGLKSWARRRIDASLAGEEVGA
jgi:hypothetical protein